MILTATAGHIWCGKPDLASSDQPPCGGEGWDPPLDARTHEVVPDMEIGTDFLRLSREIMHPDPSNRQRKRSSSAGRLVACPHTPVGVVDYLQFACRTACSSSMLGDFGGFVSASDPSPRHGFLYEVDDPPPLLSPRFP
ncbi:unnamed protein product [Clonostachys chloroleuca]|uniref:Uncharacterized protein n=1 Tax=Clonostachys chloroleuca TaxID=1926264 RepID=A0AA35LXF6_9HYPO|nr:unnamed protein product [Clonostachys chloroleuca]